MNRTGLPKTLMIGLAAVLAGSQAQATLILNTDLLASNGGIGSADTLGNDLVPDVPDNVYFGQLQATAAGTVDFFYVGNEAGYVNSFYIDDVLARAEGPDGFSPPYEYEGSLSVSANEFLDFGFCTSGGNNAGSYGKCAWNDNLNSLNAQFNYPYTIPEVGNGYRSIGFAALDSFNPAGGFSFAQPPENGPTSNLWMLLWDDSGATNDDNHDDFAVVARFRPTAVPEPGTLFLLGAGLIAMGVARRGRRIRA